MCIVLKYKFRIIQYHIVRMLNYTVMNLRVFNLSIVRRSSVKIWRVEVIQDYIFIFLSTTLQSLECKLFYIFFKIDIHTAAFVS